jgi:hypothetical protein
LAVNESEVWLPDGTVHGSAQDFHEVALFAGCNGFLKPAANTVIK